MEKDILQLDDNNLYYLNILNKKDKLTKVEFEQLQYKSFSYIPKVLEYDFYTLENLKNCLLKIKNNNCDTMMMHQMYLLQKLLSFKDLFPYCDFPNGYVLDNKEIVGMILPNYSSNSVSFQNVCIKDSLNELKNYLLRDSDNIHNVFLIYLEILDMIEKMYENGLVYYDINEGNFIFDNNKIKIIDFDYEKIGFIRTKSNLNGLLNNYLEMVNRVNSEYNLSKISNNISKTSFSSVRNKIIKLENSVRKNR